MSVPKEKKKEFAGVCGNKGYTEKDIIGSTFDNEILDITMLEREKNGIYGDKAEVFYTDILRRYKFPEFEGENFITECVVWDKIAYDKYKLRFFNEIIYLANYLQDGLTSKGNMVFKNNPRGYALFLAQRAKFENLPFTKKIIKYEQYYLMLNEKLSDREVANNLNINMFIVNIIKIRILLNKIIGDMCNYKDYYLENKNIKTINKIAKELNISVIYLHSILLVSQIRKIFRANINQIGE